MDKVMLERLKDTVYTVNFENKKYVWAGNKGGKTDKKYVPMDLFDYLQMSTKCFNNGQLVIVTETEEQKELVEDLYCKEEYLANTHTEEEITKILNGTVAKMKKELEKITSLSEKRFVMNVAKDMQIDSSSKRKFLTEWFGTQISTEDIFE